jgi:hypothetical protein
MAASDFIISSKSKLREGDLGANRPNSEAVNSKLAGSINGLIDSSFFDLDVNLPGYFSNSSIFRSAPLRVPKICDITFYQMSLIYTGTSGSTTFNVAVYDDTGAFVNNLFGTGVERLLISGNAGTNVLVGSDVVNLTNFNVNTTGHTIQYGTLNLTTLQAGYMLVPFVENFATGARSIKFNMRIREQ